jgi:tetratricopeptide (TPR) repeat protein
MLRPIIKTTVLTICFLGFIETSNAARLNSGITQDGTPCITISGEITTYDGRNFINLTDRMRHSGNPARIVLLNSSGGNLEEAARIADHVYSHKMDTKVEGSKQCSSACFLIFAAGYNRHADLSASMYVHRAMEKQRDTNRARSISIDLNDLYKEYDVPQNIRLAMLETPPNKAYKLTKSDIKQLNRGSFNYNESSRRNAHDQYYERQQQNPDKCRYGIESIQNGRLNEGIKILENCKSKDAEIYYYLGYAYAKLSKNDKAKNNLRKSLEINPDKAIAWKNLAELLAMEGDVDNAADCFVYYWEYSSDQNAAKNKLYSIVKENRGTPRAQAAAVAIGTLGL